MKKKTDKGAREREFYLKNDLGDLLGKLQPLHLDLEFPSPTESISLRLPRDVLNRIRIIADEQDIPYQSLIKTWLVKQLRRAA